MKKVSLYVKGGDTDAGYYYRFHQFFRVIDVDCRVNKMYSDYAYHRFLPIGSRPLWLKGLLWVYITLRVLFQLLRDCLDRPEYIIISRRLVSKKTPSFAKRIVRSLIKRGTKLLWDFDDNILTSKECDKKSFDFLCSVSIQIIIASPYLKSIIPSIYHSKVIIIPTIDGEAEMAYSQDVLMDRMSSYKDVFRVVWLGTQVSLPFVYSIMPHIYKAANNVKTIGKKLELAIVSDKGLEIEETENLTIRNVCWSRELALAELKKAHVGLMPLEISEFTKGKGGFKLLQYISIGLPVIATRVGINEIIVNDEMGFLTSSFDDTLWSKALEALASNPHTYYNYAVNARTTYNNSFSFNHNLYFWRNVFC